MATGRHAVGLRLLAAGCALAVAAVAASASTGAATCTGAVVTVFDNSSTLGVLDGGTPPTFSTAGKAYCLSSIVTYHYNNGKGATPGTIGLRGTTTVAPRRATGVAGSGAPNANWVVNYDATTSPVVIDGSYTCEDSSPSTWSQNSQTGGKGFCRVYGILTSAPSGSSGPAPVLGRSVAAAPVSGTVLVEEPGSHAFVPLSSAALITVGSIVDVSGGRVKLTAARAGGTSSGQFYSGEFTLTQAADGISVLTLTGGAPCAASTARASRSPPRKQSLWGAAHGNFKTSGSYAAASDLGTTWLTRDECAGTLIRVVAGRVRVHDFVTGRTFTLRAPHQYFAHA